MPDNVTIGIADMKIIRQTGTLITYALGSCIGICIYDLPIKLAGMIHIMLPGIPKSGDSKILKYADSGIAEMLKQMEKLGGSRSRFVAKIAGGAKMFDVPGESTMGGIGMRNIIASKSVLRQFNIKLSGEDTGLNYARTMLFEAETGKVIVRSYSKPDRIL